MDEGDGTDYDELPSVRPARRRPIQYGRRGASGARPRARPRALASPHALSGTHSSGGGGRAQVRRATSAEQLGKRARRDEGSDEEDEGADEGDAESSEREERKTRKPKRARPLPPLGAVPSTSEPHLSTSFAPLTTTFGFDFPASSSQKTTKGNGVTNPTTKRRVLPNPASRTTSRTSTSLAPTRNPSSRSHSSKRSEKQKGGKKEAYVEIDDEKMETEGESEGRAKKRARASSNPVPTPAASDAPVPTSAPNDAMDHDALLPSQPTAPTTTNATPRAHSTPRRVSAVLGDKSNLPRALQNERLVPSPSPRTRSVGGEGREQQHFAVAVPPRRAATAGGRASGTGGRASRAGEERINVFRDSGEEGRTARAAGMERGIIRTNSINLTTLSSALPTVEPTPATPTARSASPSGTATPLQAPLPTSPILVSRISQSLNNTQPQLELEERPTFSAFPQGRGTLYDGLGAYSMDEEELAQIYHPPAPNSGSTIPFVEGNSSMVIEDEDETEADMDLTVVVGGDVVEPAGGSGVVERENEGRGGEPIAGREGTVTSEGEIPVERRRSSLSKKLAGPTRPPTLATKRKTKKAANASPPSTHPTRRSTTQLSDSSFSDHDPLAPIDSSDTESSDIDQFRLPPRLREPRVDATLPTGPPSSEDDLAYAIRTSSTGEWDRDWDEMRELEGEVGEGFEAGARIGKWGEGTGRRERFLGLRRQVVGWEERLRVESGGSEDELLIK